MTVLAISRLSMIGVLVCAGLAMAVQRPAAQGLRLSAGGASVLVAQAPHVQKCLQSCRGHNTARCDRTNKPASSSRAAKEKAAKAVKTCVNRALAGCNTLCKS